MKKTIYTVLFAFLLALASMTIAFAHPGGLDQNGGHYDQNGNYHYHQHHSDYHPRS